MNDCAGTDEEQLKDENEKIVAHQHLVVHLKVMSEKSERLVADAYFPVTFSASILVAFIGLFLAAIPSFFTSEVVDERVQVLFYKASVGILIFIYGGMVLSNYILKRQFRQFCHHVLTLAYHLHEISEHESKEKGNSSSAKLQFVSDALKGAAD